VGPPAARRRRGELGVGAGWNLSLRAEPPGPAAVPGDRPRGSSGRRAPTEAPTLRSSPPPAGLWSRDGRNGEVSMTHQLPIPDGVLAPLCARHRIRCLSLFGSVLKGTDRPDSDVELLVEFEPGASLRAGRSSWSRRSTGSCPSVAISSTSSGAPSGSDHGRCHQGLGPPGATPAWVRLASSTASWRSSPRLRHAVAAGR